MTAAFSCWMTSGSATDPVVKTTAQMTYDRTAGTVTQTLTAERACVRISPLALRSHRVVLSEVRLEKPWIEIAKVPGTQETTLQRAIAPRVESSPSGPLQWIIEVQDLQLHRGAATVRPELGEPANFALEDLEVPQARAR